MVQICSSPRSKKIFCQAGSPGLVVMGGDSSYEGCGSESYLRIMDGHFYYVCLKRRK